MSDSLGTLTWAGAAQRAHGRCYLFMPEATWALVAATGLLVALLMYPWYSADSLWVGAAVALVVAVVSQSLWASAHAPWIPGLVVVTAAIQWVLAPWASYHIGPDYPLYRMVVPQPEYFAFAVPATLALTAGIYLPALLAGVGRAARPAGPALPSTAARSSFRYTCDGLVLVAVVVSLFVLPSLPVSYHYVGTLVVDLGFVSAFALCLMRAPQWSWRIIAMLGSQLIAASADGVFHDLLLWTTYFALILGFRRKVRGRTLLVLAAAGTYAVAALNSIKFAYRRDLVFAAAPSAEQRVSMLGDALGRQILHPDQVFADDEILYGVTRLNQGWIIGRVMERVPVAEPYARGETVVNALVSAAVPRVMRPGKYIAGGDPYFERFTGVRLRGAAMNLGLAGEMYANFGPVGGCIGVLLWGLLVGILFVRFARAAQRSSLWWAWAPFVMLYTAEAESGVGEVVNQVAKSALVMLAIVSIVPVWRGLRTWRVPALRSRPDSVPA